MKAWPALRELDWDGWVLRFSEGYTKRANSVNPVFGSSLDTGDKVAHCERLYQQEGLPCIFRLTPFALPPELDQLLERRGYRVIDPSLVLYLPLHGWKLAGHPSQDLAIGTLEAWMEAYGRLTDQPPDQQGTHKAMLSSVPSSVRQPYQRLLASLERSGETVACALGVLEEDWFGLFDLVVARGQRRNGHGTALAISMLRWAQERGAAHAYLQVVQGNTPARALYAKLGFAEAYPYWYRVVGTSPPLVPWTGM
jgi:GNAT superfamily N-acetyltransferase